LESIIYHDEKVIDVYLSITFSSYLNLFGESMLPNFKIGVGTIAWRNQLIWDYGIAYDEQSLYEVFSRSLQNGIRFFSTSEAFTDGDSERILGRFAAKHPEQAFISTKYVPRPWRIRRSDFLRAMNASLARLQLRRLDLYQIGQPTGLMGIPMLVECAAEALDTGMVKNIGLSDFKANEIEQFSDLLNRLGGAVSCVETEYNLLNREIETNGVLKICQDLHIPVIAQCPLAMGLLTGKYLNEPIVNGLRRKIMQRYPTNGLNGLIRLMNLIGSEHEGRNSAQVALNWLIQKKVIPIPGIKNVEQLDQNRTVTEWDLKPEEVARLDDYSAGLAVGTE